MIHNYFEKTFFFNPDELFDHPDIRVCLHDATRNRTEKWLRSGGDYNPHVRFVWQGFYFHLRYRGDQEYAMNMEGVGGSTDSHRNQYYQAEGLLDAAIKGVEKFRNQMFTDTLTYFVTEIFTKPYAYRKVDVVDKDVENFKAALIVDQTIKAAFVFRPEDAQSFRISVATPWGVESVRENHRGHLGVKFRKLITRIYRNKL